MDIVINWLKEFFHASYDAIAGVIITLVTFVIGYLVNHFNNVRIAANSRGVYRDMIILNISILLTEVKKQKLGLEAFSPNLTIENRESFILKLSDVPSVKVFSGIGYENSYKAFFTGIENFKRKKNRRKEHFNQLWNLVYYFADEQQIITANYVNFTRTAIDLEEQRNMVVGEVGNIIDQIISATAGQTLPSEVVLFCEDLHIIVKDFVTRNDYTAPKNVYNYQQELKNLYKKHHNQISKYEDLLHMNKMISKINLASLRYQNLKNLIDTERKSFTYRIELFDKHILLLGEILLVLKG